MQLVALPVADAQLPEADALAGRGVGAGLRAVVARPESGSLGARIRASRLVPYQVVIGAREAAARRFSAGRSRQPSVVSGATHTLK